MTTKVKGSAFTSQDNLSYINLLDINGAKGDGIVDNTSYINTALATGLPVYIPAGTFLTGAITVPVNSVIFGSGVLSVIKLKTTGNATVLSLGSGTTIRDLTINGDKANQVGSGFHGVKITNGVLSKLINLNIINAKGDGVNVTGTSTSKVLIQSCNVTGFTGSGITVDSGSFVTIDSCNTHTSDVTASPGNGVSLVSAGSAGSLISVTGCAAHNNQGSGFAVKGSGTKNITDVTITGCISSSNTLSGYHLQTVDRVTISGCIGNLNTVDGFRLEGDVQYSRINQCIGNTNTQFGFREVVSGSTPNFNGFMYETSTGNGTNTVTKVGANSTVFSV